MNGIVACPRANNMKPSGEKDDCLEAIVFLQTHGLLPETMRALRAAWLSGEKPLVPPDVSALMQTTRYAMWEHDQLCQQALLMDNQRAWLLVKSLLAENALFRRALGFAPDDLSRHIQPHQRCEDAEPLTYSPSALPIPKPPYAHGEPEGQGSKRRRGECGGLA